MCRGVRLGAVLLVLAFLSAGYSLGAAQDKGERGSGEPEGRQRKGEELKKSTLLHGAKKGVGWIPPGLSEEEQADWKDGRPPGWSRGGKEGWKDADMPPGHAKKGGELPPGLAKKIPPGWSEWNVKKKTDWEKELREARRRVRRVANRLRDFRGNDLRSALLSVEATARVGAPIRHVLGLVEEAMERGIRGRGIETATRAMAYGVGRQMDFDELGKFIHKKLEDGFRDDELAIEIYREVAIRHEQRLKAKKAIPQEKEETEPEQQ